MVVTRMLMASPAPAGTLATTSVSCQARIAGLGIPPKVMVPAMAPKPVPLTVTASPFFPVDGSTEATFGAEMKTFNIVL